MTRYVVECIYARLESESVEVDADTPEEAEQKAIGKLKDDMEENCHLERVAAVWIEGETENQLIEPSREYIEVQPTPLVEIAVHGGIAHVKTKTRGVSAEIRDYDIEAADPNDLVSEDDGVLHYLTEVCGPDIEIANYNIVEPVPVS